MAKQGVTYLLSNVGGKLGAIDGMIGASTSQGNTTAAVSGTVTASVGWVENPTKPYISR